MRAFVLVASVAALVVPGVAPAEPTLVSRDLPLQRHGVRSLAVAQTTPRFDLVGLHWQGAGAVRFRARSLDGRWSAWHSAAPEAEDLPDSGSAESRRSRAWRLGSPFWTGPSNRIEYRTSPSVYRLRAELVRSPTEAVPLRTTTVAGSPAIVSRFAWGAVESIRRSHPFYAPSVRLAIVHHTAGSNSYTRAQSAAIVRAIEVYHVKGNGWNDIGYNFLVDKYGQVFEGRAGGIMRNVIGAHAQGFNTGSVGISLLGDYDSAKPSAAAEAALERLIAWRLDVAHVDPVSTLTYISNGNPRFPAGTPVFMRAVSGHRDTGFTSCPGNTLYRRINVLAATAEKTGLPKLYSPRVTGSIGGRVRFTGRLSQALPWAVAVTASGATVAHGAGTSSRIDWTWDARSAARRPYAYAVDAGSVRGVRGTIGNGSTTSPPPAVPPPPPPPPPAKPLIKALSVAPPILSPNGDGVDDLATVTYTLAAAGQVTATLLNAFGTVVTMPFTGRETPGKQSFRFDPAGILAGDYTLLVSLRTDDGRTSTASASISIL